MCSSLRCGGSKCLPVSAHRAQNVVRHRHWSITRRPTIRIAVPDMFELSEGPWSPLCHASRLPQTLAGCILQVIHDVHFGEERQHNFTASASAFRAQQTCNHCRPWRTDQSKYSNLQGNHTWRPAQPNTQSRWFSFVVAVVPIECAWKL